MSTTLETAPDLAMISPNLRDALVGLVGELRDSTADYCRTGEKLVQTQILRDDTVTRTTSREDILRVHHTAAIEAGKNETQRKLIANQLLHDDTMLRGLREDAAKLTTAYLQYERAHKNAAAQMLSLRVRIAALTALIGGAA